jgi:D-alanyl-lipoteichoic acid acyltransferase DltB (MBOAT superfamily)
MTFWESLFIFDEKNPMVFTTGLFWFWFALIIGLYQFFHSKIFLRNFFLTAFSLYFYYKSGGYFFFLLVFSTILDYYIGWGLFRIENKKKRLWLLVTSLVSNLGLLAYYKYAYFFTNIFNQSFKTNIELIDYLALACNEIFGSTLPIDKIILPVGISFYTFQTLSYSIDIYKKELTPTKNILDFAFFVTFFPQLVAGPIVRASDFIPQIYNKYALTKAEYNHAIFLIINGLIKKILVSNYISTNFVDRVFENPNAFSGLETLLAVYGYAIQIYCDFSGYTDIAIGLALLLGFRLNLNFDSPYISASITEFWRRWHISLSSWLRDYLYIPLGGNRGASIFTYLFLPIVLYILWIVDGARVGIDIRNGVFLSVVILIWAVQVLSKLKILGYLHVIASIIFMSWLSIDFLKNIYLVSGLLITLVFQIILLIKPTLKRSITTYANLSITMLLGGLWHGASVNFIIWGALHGGALALHKFYMDITGTKNATQKGFRKLVGQIITFHFVCFCWIFFRATDTEKVGKILYQIFYSFNGQIFIQVLQGYSLVIGLLVIGFLVHWLPKHWKITYQNLFGKMPDMIKALIIAIVIVILYQANTGYQPFIYFQF